jgi:hypothetical protein
LCWKFLLEEFFSFHLERFELILFLQWDEAGFI